MHSRPARKLAFAFISLAFLTALTACGQGAPVPQPAVTPSVTGLPAPSRLPQPQAKTASGGYADKNRLLVAFGDAISADAGMSHNAVVNDSENYCALMGQTGQLNYAIFPVSSAALKAGSTLTEVGLDYRWSGVPPVAPSGVYIGIADLAKDTWVWLDGSDALRSWKDISSLNIAGAATGASTYIAVVNASKTTGLLYNVNLRYRTAATVDGDEWIYYGSRKAPDPTFYIGVSRVRPAGGATHLLHDATDAGIFNAMFISWYGNRYVLQDAYEQTGYYQYVQVSDLDGKNSQILFSGPGADYFAAGWSPNGKKALFRRSNEDNGFFNLHAANMSTQSNGRLSRTTDDIGKAVWDLSIDENGTQYGAIADKNIGDLYDGPYTIVQFRGSPPFDINDSPTVLFHQLPNEDSRDPEMVEFADFDGNPLYYIYFRSKNRDGANYNLYRIRYGIGTDPRVELVLNDASSDLRDPTPAPNGRWLAYFRHSGGVTDEAQLELVDLVFPGTPKVLATDGVRAISWLDPTP